jgi:hypothetical protein
MKTLIKEVTKVASFFLCVIVLDPLRMLLKQNYLNA